MQSRNWIVVVATLTMLMDSGCHKLDYVGTYDATKTSFGPVAVSIGAVPVSGAYAGPISGDGTPNGSNSPWSCTTNFVGLQTATGTVFSPAYGTCQAGALAEPAYWNVTLQWPNTCYNLTSNPVATYPNPQTETDVPFTTQTTSFDCYISPQVDTVPSNTTPQVVLDSAVPSSIKVASSASITSPVSSTYLEVFNNAANNVVNMPALSIGSNGSSATFDYPTQNSASPLVSGAYVGAIASIGSNGSSTVFGMQPFFVAHNDTTWPEAFGIALGNNGYVQVSCSASGGGGGHGSCESNVTCTSTTSTQPDFPVVTLPIKNQIALGTSSSTTSVGTLPTAIVGYGVGVKSAAHACAWSPQTEYYTGSTNALVVNTGSNTISLVAINPTVSMPTGTVAVGSLPVAATVVNKFGYIANWGSGTISEVNLTTLAQTRTLPVVAHPSSIWYDPTGGNLWVGGQGGISKVSLSSWSVSQTVSVDGTVTSLTLDSTSGNLYHTLLQNGSVLSPSRGTTEANAVFVMPKSGISYSTQGIYSTTNNTETVQAPGPDNSTYAASPLAAALPFAGQLAFTSPSAKSSSNGNFIAITEGTTYAVIQASTGSVVISGSMPSTIRSSVLGSTVLYLTLPDSNSVVSIPITIPQQ